MSNGKNETGNNSSGEEKLLNFFRFIHKNNLDGSICFFENNFQCFIMNRDKLNILVSGEGKTPMDAVNDASQALVKIGFF